MKIYSKSLTTREMKIKSIVRYHYIHKRRGQISKIGNSKSQKGCSATRILIYCWWECKMVQTLCKSFWQFLIKINIHLPNGNYTSRYLCNRNESTDSHNFTLHKESNQEITQMFISRTMDKQTIVYSASGIIFGNKKNKLLVHATMWMKLKISK